MMLHDMPTGAGDERVVYVASDQDRILTICRQPEGIYRIFDGYSGWGPEQLERELLEGGWSVWEIEPDQIFTDAEKLWEFARSQIGRSILASSVNPQLMPDDPTIN